MRRFSLWTAFVMAGALWFSGCQEPAARGAPELEEMSPAFLDREVQEAMAAIGRARESAGKDPEASAEALADAEKPLRRLKEYYLPLLGLRERANRAVLLQAQGQTATLGEELQRIEQDLKELAESNEGDTARAMSEPMQAVAAARAALDRSPEEASKQLELLARTLNALLVKGRMVGE